MAAHVHSNYLSPRCRFSRKVSTSTNHPPQQKPREDIYPLLKIVILRSRAKMLLARSWVTTETKNNAGKLGRSTQQASGCQVLPFFLGHVFDDKTL